MQLVETHATARRGRLARRTLGLAALSGAALLGALVPAAQAGLTDRVSVSSAGAQGNANSQYSAMSADGRYVSFSSSASNLVAGDTNATRDVFVHDRQSGETRRVSVSGAGAQANGSSDGPAISADGRYVSFTSDARNLVAGDTNNSFDVFVHDRQSGETRRVSVSSAGGQATRSSLGVAISADGRYVSFNSIASNLVAGDTNAGPINANLDVFVHDRQSGETRRVSVSSAGAQANGSSAGGAISADGRYVSFFSNAPNVVTGDGNGVYDVFVHDRQSGETRRVSVSSAGAQANGASYVTAISASGRFVGLSSFASNLVAGDTNAKQDVFVHDRQSGETRRVSVSSAGAQANDLSHGSAMSADGRYLSFNSRGSNLVAGDTNAGEDVFLHDRRRGETRRVSVSSAGAEASGVSSFPAISPGGRYVSFFSTAPNLVAGDTNNAIDLFVHDDIAARDTTPPRLDLPESIVRDATSAWGAAVSYAASATDDRDGAVPVDCAPRSGATFPIGATTVHCEATDSEENTATGNFKVTVTDPNLIYSDGFETDLAGWNTSGSAAGVELTRDAGGHSSGWAARLANTATSAGACALNDSPNVVGITAGGGYTARLWVRADTAGASLKLRLREYSGAGLVGGATKQVELTKEWQPVSVDYAPRSPGTSWLDVNAYVTGAEPGTCFYADDVAIKHDPTAPPPDGNLVVNPGFETELLGWGTSGSAAGVTLARAEGGHSGGWAAKLTNTGTSAGTCTLNDSPNIVTTTASGGYTATLWVRADTDGQTLKLRLREYSTGTLVGSATSALTLTTAWQQVSVSYTPVAPGASTLDLNAYATGAPPGTCFLADDATIQRN